MSVSSDHLTEHTPVNNTEMYTDWLEPVLFEVCVMQNVLWWKESLLVNLTNKQYFAELKCLSNTNLY